MLELENKDFKMTMVNMLQNLLKEKCATYKEIKNFNQAAKTEKKDA